MIVTVTLNPAIDRTVSIEKLRPGTVMRSKSVTTCPGGKGINVSRAVKCAGGDTRAVCFKGGVTGEMLLELLAKEGVEALCVDSADTRISIQIAEEDGRFSNINDRGGPVSAPQLARLEAVIEKTLGQGDILVLSGAVPYGAPPDIYATLCEKFRARCKCVAVDADGDALKGAIAARPAIVKPNEHELSRYYGRELVTFPDLVEHAKKLAAEISGLVLLSLGGDGCALISGDTVYRSHPAKVRAISTVGAGDSLLAGFLTKLDCGAPLPLCLHFASALATAKVQLPGTTMPTAAQIERCMDLIKIEQL